MECRDFKEWVMDKDILDEGVEANVKEHIKICERCRKLYTMDSLIEAQIKNGLKEVDVPDGLLDLIEMNVQSATKDKPVIRFRWKTLVRTFVMAALLFIFLSPFTGKFKSIDEIGSLAVENHLDNDMAMAFRAGEVRDVSRWFKERLGFKVTLPDIEKQGYQLIGGRKCLLGKKDVAYLLYVKAGEKVSLFTIEAKSLNFNMEEAGTYDLSIEGCGVKVWKRGEQVYVMVE